MGHRNPAKRILGFLILSDQTDQTTGQLLQASKTYYNFNDDIILNKTSNNHSNDTYYITNNNNLYIHNLFSIYVYIYIYIYICIHLYSILLYIKLYIYGSYIEPVIYTYIVYTYIVTCTYT